MSSGPIHGRYRSVKDVVHAAVLFHAFHRCYILRLLDYAYGSVVARRVGAYLAWVFVCEISAYGAVFHFCFGACYGLCERVCFLVIERQDMEREALRCFASYARKL